MIKIIFLLLTLVLYSLSKEYHITPLNDKNKIIVDDINNTLKFKNIKKDYLILEYFGFGCPVCIAEIPELKKIVFDEKNIQILAIHIQKVSNRGIKTFISDHEINYPIISYKDKDIFYTFAQNNIPYWNGGIPMMIILDKNSTPIGYFIGKVTKSDIIKSLQHYEK